MAAYTRPIRLGEALAILERERPRVLAGGTDLYASPDASLADRAVLDLTAVGELRGIRETKTGWRIGGAATWTAVFEAPLPVYFDALRQAAREVGGVQIQNTGTVAGNLCNASPAADGVPPLLALDASVELASRKETRSLRLQDFILGPRKTALRDDEILVAITVPKPAGPASSRFLKLGARRYLLISIAMVAVAVELRGKAIGSARIAVGACSPVARRLPELEAALIGRPLAPAIGEVPQAGHFAALSPIDDVRATGEYRREAALELVRRALRELA